MNRIEVLNRSRHGRRSALPGALMAAAIACLVWPFTAGAAQITGIVNGYDCATEGEKCPVDRLDPHITLEADFVVQMPDGRYVLIPNVPRDIKVRHVLERVRVSGEMKPEYSSLKASQFERYDATTERFVTVWSPALVERERMRRIQEALQRQMGL